MCGRGRFMLSSNEIKSSLNARKLTNNQEDDTDKDDEENLFRENFGPGMKSFIVALNVADSATTKSDRILLDAQWGLIPAYTKGPISSQDFFKKFNARSDNLEFVHSRILGKKHCIVCMSGFYEWKTVNNKKYPYYVTSKDSSSTRPFLCFAGLYDECTIENELLRTFAIVTVDASDEFSVIHTRMPAILETDEEIAKWLSGPKDAKTLQTLLKPRNCLKWHAVTPAMGKTSYQLPDCSIEMKTEPVQTLKDLWSAQSPSTKRSIEKTEVFENKEVIDLSATESSPTKPSPSRSPQKKSKIEKGQPLLTSFFSKK